jgi:succinyl-CoA synthetase beta subunit
MNIHEYQAKALLKQYDIPVPQGGVASSGLVITEDQQMVALDAKIAFDDNAMY